MQGVNQKYICDSFNDSSTPKKSIWEALCFLLKYLPYCDALMYWDRGGREIEMEMNDQLHWMISKNVLLIGTETKEIFLTL